MTAFGGQRFRDAAASLACLRLPRIGRKPTSVGACLSAIVWACALSSAAAAAFALYSAYAAMQATLVRQAQTSSRSMARAVDGAISTASLQLEALATAESLASDDIARFEDLARRVQPYQAGDNLVLTAASGQQLVNTALRRGAPLPMHGNRDLQKTVLASGRPQISDLFLGGALRKPLIAIEVPVRQGARVPYTLAMGFLPSRFESLLAEQRPDPGWVVSILDSTGTIVARTHEANRFVGQKGASGLLAAMQTGPDGTVETVTLEGTPVIAVFSRSAVARWTVAVGIPEAVLLGELRRWITYAVLLSAAILAVGTVMAHIVSRRIAGALRALIAPADALGRGEPVLPPALAVAEAQQVGDALARASELLLARTSERDVATKERAVVAAKANAFEHAASHDALTGLPNRAQFFESLDAHVARHERLGGGFTVIFVDLDDFKPVNDAHGHAVGDELLCAFAARLRASFRDRDLVARLGGDEFGVIVDAHSREELESMERHLLASLSRPYGIRHLTIRVSACAGAAIYPANGRDGPSLVEAADAAMYRAKSGGKAGFFVSGD